MMRYTGRKGWDCGFSDAWNLDFTLSPIILAGLKKFKEMNRNGVPSKLLKDLSEKEIIGKPDENHVYSDEDMEKASKEWELIIDKMIFSFGADEDLPDEEYDYSISMESGEPDEKGLISSDIKVSNEKEWERYVADKKVFVERKEEGFELFGKYFSSLWD